MMPRLSKLACALLLASLAAVAVAGPVQKESVTAGAADNFDFSYLDDTEKLMRQIKGHAAPVWLKPAAVDAKTTKSITEIATDGQRIQQLTAAALAAAAARTTLTASPSAQATPPALTPQEQSAPRVLISLGIPETNLKTILEAVADCGCVAVFQGVPQGWSIPQMVKHVGRLVDKNHVPTVTIDPNIFVDLRAAAVPVVALPAGNGKYVTMRGLVNLDWMRHKAPHPEQIAGVDLGSYGPTFAVTEPNLMDEMKRRILAVDWKTKRDGAVSRFWSKKDDWIDLPEAQESTTRYIDPTLVLGADIKNGDGQVLVRAGRSVNPLKYMPLTKRYIVFDGTKAWQVKAALQARDEARKAGRGAQLVMSHFDTAANWEGYEHLADKFQQHVYILDPGVKNRFQLRALPSIVEADGLRLRVTEIAKKDAK